VQPVVSLESSEKRSRVLVPVLAVLLTLCHFTWVDARER
jgi:hypothetical protein